MTFSQEGDPDLQRTRRRGVKAVTAEVIGIDHVCVRVSELRSSEEFYGRAMGALRFRIRRGTIGGYHYFNAITPTR